MTATYVGTELELFRVARNWKAYFRRILSPHIVGDVGEVGAGIGTTTEVLASLPAVRNWLCIEMDTNQCQKIEVMRASGAFANHVDIHAGTLADLPAEPFFDSIVYIDVLEHIEDDRREIEHAFTRLRTDGRIVILAPAWSFLYSPFDRSIGHYRRYTLSTLRRLAPPYAREVDARYLDSAGFFASLANKLFLRQDMPHMSQIMTWDRILIPISRVVDRLGLWLVGRSVIIVWEKSRR